MGRAFSWGNLPELSAGTLGERGTVPFLSNLQLREDKSSKYSLSTVFCRKQKAGTDVPASNDFGFCGLCMGELSAGLWLAGWHPSSALPGKATHVVLLLP